MPENNSSRDPNEIQRERSETRLRAMALDEVASALEQANVDILTREGRKELRLRLDYLDYLYKNQDSNREALNFSRLLMLMQPSTQTALEWVAKRMKAEEANKEAIRKTIVDRLSGGVAWLLIGGIGGSIIAIATKGHLP